MKKVSIVIPAHNEEENVYLISERIKNVFDSLSCYFYQIIFVNDGSRDNTQKKLEELSLLDDRVKYIEFSRNFGHQSSVKAGMDLSDGNIVISMDADLQHPPELIPKLIEKWEKGYDIVYTIRKYPKEISFFKRVTSSLFYRFFSYISDIDMGEGGYSDFRLMDASVVEKIKEIQEDDLFLRGLTSWIGFKQVGVEFTSGERIHGESSYNLKKMLRFAFTGITAFSVKPLYMAAYLGIIFSVLSILYIPYVVYSFVTRSEISGWASLIMTVAFFGGLQLIILGIIGIYIGKIFNQVKQRPKYIIRSKNF